MRFCYFINLSGAGVTMGILRFNLIFLGEGKAQFDPLRQGVDFVLGQFSDGGHLVILILVGNHL